MTDYAALMSSSSFSSCGLYRWFLKRTLSKRKKIIVFIGLNPSYASSFRDDQTLRRLINFSSSWGYGTLIVVNLFARVSRNPSMLRNCSDPIGKRNDEELHARLDFWSNEPSCDLWLGWGAKGSFLNRSFNVIENIRFYLSNRAIKSPSSLGPMTLGTTLKGHPVHPLYIPANTSLRPFNFIQP